MKIFYATLLALLFFLPACQRPLDFIDYDLLGNWSSRRFYLEIAANGRGYLERGGILGFDGVEGRIVVENDRIKFRSDTRNRNFNIDVYPYFDEPSGFVIMVLDGEEFFLQ